VWARQIRSEGVVGPKASVAFHTWTVDTGPILDAVTEVWDQIANDLAKNEVPSAAGRLRRHMEYVAAELADELGAQVRFKGDGSYDMGELLSSVIKRQGDLLKLAGKAARSWKNDAAVSKVEELQTARSKILSESNDEQWAINKAIHYNEWFALSKNDFAPVVAVFKRLLEQFRCEKCDTWLSVVPRHDPMELRCSCGHFHLNLNEK
jgi:hypothetical protein